MAVLHGSRGWLEGACCRAPRLPWARGPVLPGRRAARGRGQRVPGPAPVGSPGAWHSWSPVSCSAKTIRRFQASHPARDLGEKPPRGVQGVLHARGRVAPTRPPPGLPWAAPPPPSPRGQARVSASGRTGGASLHTHTPPLHGGDQTLGKGPWQVSQKGARATPGKRPLLVTGSFTPAETP